MNIRKAIEQDRDSIYTFIVELEEHALDPEQFQKVYMKNLADNDCYYLVAEDQGELVGFASLHIQSLLHHCGDTGEIQELFVRSDYRSKGIGHLLMKEIESIARDIHLQEIEVTTSMRRLRAHHFYAENTYTNTHLKFTKPLS